MNRTYTQLLSKGAERSTYRKRPIETLDEVEKIKEKIKSQKLAGKDVKIKTMEKLTPTGIAISEAKRKSGRKAFKEQVELFELQQKLRELKNKGASQKDIEQFYAKQLKIQKMEKDLMLLRDEPEKYQAKLQELNQLKQEQNIQTQLLEEIKNQGLALTRLTHLYSGMLTPAQLLQASPAFQDLTPTEKKVALDNLQKQIPRDRVKQKEIINELLTQPVEVIERLKQGVRLETKLLESQKPVKAKAVELKQQAPRDYYGEAMTKALDIIEKTKFDDANQKDYVTNSIQIDLNRMSDSSLDKLTQAFFKKYINGYKAEYNRLKPKATDILIEQADDDAQEAELEGQNISSAINTALTQEVRQQEIHPQLTPLIPVVAREMQATDNNISDEEANMDAVEVIQSVSSDLQKDKEASEFMELLRQDLQQAPAGVPPPPPPPPPLPTAEQLKSLRPNTIKKMLKDEGIEPKKGKGTTEENRNMLLDAIAKGVKLKSVETPSSKPPIPPKPVKLTVHQQAAQQAAMMAKKRAEQSSKVGDIETRIEEQKKQRAQQAVNMEESKDLQSVFQRAFLKKAFSKKFAQASPLTEDEDTEGEGFKQASGKGFFSDLYNKINLWTFRNINPIGRMITHFEQSKGKGFMPLENYPSHLIAGSLAHHMKRVQNKRKLMKVTLHKPFENTENQEYRKNLTRNAINDVKGGKIFGSFLD